MATPNTELHPELIPAVTDAEQRAELEQARRLAERYRLEFIDMDTFRIDQDLFRSIPADLMLRYAFVPYRRVGSMLEIVVSDPTNLPMIDELETLLATRIKVAVGPKSAIESILKKSESSQRVLEEATDSCQLQLLKEEENGDESLTVERLTSDISPIIRLVDSTIYTAIQRRASDIHIETQDDAVHVKYRIDGVLQPAMRPIAKQFHSSIISRIKVMAELDIAEKRVPQYGRLRLRSILRHDPDKIMVGEIRDNETAQIAINSALTGHLVFTTVHANNVLDVLGRFLNMGVEAYQFVSALNCVLAQRLVRNICLHCKRPSKVSRALLEESALDPALEYSQTFYEGIGCIECGGTGYKGRTAICELLDLSDHIREMILEKRPTSEIKKAAREESMRFLRESAVEQVMAGVTTLREINKVTFVE